MTEQDVNNTLHSFDVIKQYQASGQSFEDFFEENKSMNVLINSKMYNI